jgi:hypothetical protein
MSFQQVRKLLESGGEHLGDLIWWTLAEVRINRPTLESIWASAQLLPSLLPEPPTAEKALKTAVREAAVGQANRLIRLGLENENEIVFAVIAESHDDAGNVHHHQETRVILHRQAGTISSDIPGHDLAGVIGARFRELRSTHTPDDIRRAMMKVLESCAAVTLRDHGGVYWVPSIYGDTVRRLQEAVEKIGSSRVYLLPVHASGEATRTLGDAATLAIEEELAALKSEVEGFMASPPDRPSTLVRRLDTFEALTARAELYRQVLNVHVQDLETTLRDLAGSVEKLLDQKAAA